MFEGCGKLVYQFPQVTARIRGEVAGLIGLRYYDPVLGAPRHVLCVTSS